MAEVKEQKKKRKLNRDPIGDSGLTEGFASKFSLEFRQELQGRQGSINYQKMVTSDLQTGMISKVYKNPIKSCKWDIAEIENPTKQEEQAVKLLKSWFFKDNKTQFKTLINQILSMLDYGFSVFELIFTDYVLDGNVYIVPKLKQRLQISIDEIEPENQIVKQIKTSGGVVEIPFENLVFFILDQMGEDMRGQSLFRNAYPYWADNNVYRQLIGIGVQRHAVGVPVMTVPDDVSIDNPDYEQAEELLLNLLSHEDAYMIIKESYAFDIKAGNFDPSKVQALIDGNDRKMALSALAQFMMLGQEGSGGSYSLSEDQSDLFLNAIIYIVELIEETFHRFVTIPIIKNNFGSTVDTDRIRIRGLNLNKKAGLKIAEAIKKYVESGMIKATVEDENHARKILGLPKLSDEEISLRQKERTDTEGLHNPVKTVVKLSEGKRNARVDLINREVRALHNFMKDNLSLMRDKLIEDIRSELNRGSVEIRGLKNIRIQHLKTYRRNLRKKLANLMNLGWMRMKSQAKRNNVKFAEDLDPKDLPEEVLRQYIINKSSELADDQANNMKHKAIYSAQFNKEVRGLSINQSVAKVTEVIDEFVDSNKITVGASLAVVESINFGELEFNRRIANELWGYRFIAVDDDKTTDICNSLNNKTYAVNSIELAEVTPPLHPNCRSYLEPIYKAVETKPELDNFIPAPSILKQKTIK